MTANDTVFSTSATPVFSRSPEIVKRRLKAGYPEGWTRVYVGETGDILSIAEYLYGQRIGSVIKDFEEIVKKSQMAMYKRDPKRLYALMEQKARKILDEKDEEKK